MVRFFVSHKPHSFLYLRYRLSGLRVAWCLIMALFVMWTPPAFPYALAQNDPLATHVVQIGETLSEIAAAYGISTAELMALNGITDADQIYIGQELALPANVRSSDP